MGCAVDGAPLHATRRPPGRHRIPVRPALQKFISAHGELLCLHGRQMNIYCLSCCAKCTAPGDGTVYGAPLLGLHGSSIVTKHSPSP